MAFPRSSATDLRAARTYRAPGQRIAPAVDAVRSAQVLPPRVYALGCGGVLATGLIVRWLLALHLYLLPNSDQAMVGLMARHIASGERPVFYWGQPYNGTLESYITALLLRLDGSGLAILHVAPIAFSLLFLWATMALCRHLYAERLALLCGAYLTFGTAALMEYSVWPGYNYLQAMAFGTAALVLTLSATETGRWERLPPAAFLLGLALWAQPLAVAYVPAVLVLLVGPVRHIRHWIQALGIGALSIAALITALLPVIAFNRDTGWSTLRFLATRPSNTHISALEAARRLVAWAVPVLLGILPPTEDPVQFQRYLHAHPLLYLMAWGIMLLGIGLCVTQLDILRRWCASILADRPAGELALLVLAATVTVGYLFSSWSSTRWSATDPRYLLPLYTLAPMAVRALWPPRASSTRRILGAGLLALLAVSGLASNGSAAPKLSHLDALARLLEQHGISAVYGDYWVVYKLTYEADERIVPLVTRANLEPGYNRYAPYLNAAERARHFAWIVPARSATERALLACLARHDAGSRQLRFSELAIYFGIPPSARCITGRAEPFNLAR